MTYATPHLLFIDDEPNILQGLRRRLHPFRHLWKAHFAHDVEEALALMQSKAPDVIVTDMRMPLLGGRFLLESAAGMLPGSLRLVLSGHASEKGRTRTMNTSHQFLHKPYKAEMLIRRLERHFSNRRAFLDPDLHRDLASLAALPSLMATHDLMSQNQPYLDGGMVAALDDIALTLKLLKLSHSAYCGQVHAANTPKKALDAIGYDALAHMMQENALLAPLSRAAPVRHIQVQCHRMGVWLRHQVAESSWGQDLCPREADLLQTIALLTPIGRLALTELRPECYAEEATAVSVQEKRILGHSHYRIGAALCDLWGLPEDFSNTLHRLDRMTDQRPKKRPKICPNIQALSKLCREGDRRFFHPRW